VSLEEHGHAGDHTRGINRLRLEFLD
jgi:hypothetical protein